MITFERNISQGYHHLVLNGKTKYIYKLNRSIFVEGVAKRPAKKSTLSCCNSAELSVLKTILEQKAQHENANLRKNKDGDNVLKVV